MNNKKIKKIVFVLCLWLALPVISRASEISFETTKNTVAPNEDFIVQVFFSPDAVSVNALEGTILFPSDSVDLKEIRDGNTSVNFWVEKPHSDRVGAVTFSGITTGGFPQAKNALFSMIFHAKQAGTGTFLLEHVQAFKNDGTGERTTVSGNPFSFFVSTTSDVSAPDDLTIVDTEGPEIFKPYIGSDPEIYSGKYFLVFSTKDKGSGVDHYEVKEGNWGKYVIAENPYLLADQSLHKKIYITAIDKNGNKTTVSLDAQKTAWYQHYLVIVIILLVCIFIYKKRWLPFTKKTS